MTVGFNDSRYGDLLPNLPLFNFHMYTLTRVNTNSAGVVTSITLRNPWGFDGAGNDGNTSDGLITVTVDQIYKLRGVVNYGHV